MSIDWKEGDLAVCVKNSWGYNWQYNPNIGDVLRVTQCGLFDGETALGFEGKPLRHGWIESAFRKAIPDNRPCDAGFAKLVKGKNHGNV